MTLDRFQIETMRGVLREYWEKAGHSHGAPDALCDYALRYWWLRNEMPRPIEGNAAWLRRGDDLDDAVDAALRDVQPSAAVDRGNDGT